VGLEVRCDRSDVLFSRDLNAVRSTAICAARAHLEDVGERCIVADMALPATERPAMPDYGVDTDDWDGLPWSWAAERLIGSRNYWLVTVSAAGRPHSMPVWGLWHDESLRFAFSCAPGSRKARNLQDDGRAVVTVDDTVECVSIEGRCHLVEDDVLHEAWIERYLTKYRPMSAALDSAFLRANLFWEFVPERGFGIIERDEEFAQRATRWTFD
jgi:hypothetical protein